MLLNFAFLAALPLFVATGWATASFCRLWFHSTSDFLASVSVQGPCDPHQTPISTLGIVEGVTITIISRKAADEDNWTSNPQVLPSVLLSELADEPDTVCDGLELFPWTVITCCTSQYVSFSTWDASSVPDLH